MAKRTKSSKRKRCPNGCHKAKKTTKKAASKRAGQKGKKKAAAKKKTTKKISAMKKTLLRAFLPTRKSINRDLKSIGRGSVSTSRSTPSVSQMPAMGKTKDVVRSAVAANIASKKAVYSRDVRAADLAKVQLRKAQNVSDRSAVNVAEEFKELKASKQPAEPHVASQVAGALARESVKRSAVGMIPGAEQAAEVGATALAERLVHVIPDYGTKFMRFR